MAYSVLAQFIAQAKQVKDVEALRAWYTTAAALCRRAIKDADPDNCQQLMKLLEL